MKNIKSNIDLTANTKMSTGALVITNPNNVNFTKNLVKLLGTDPSLFLITHIERLTSPSTYFVHCYLVHTDQSLLNGKASTVLATFDIRGKPFEKVSYTTTQQHVLCDASSCH